MYESALKGWSIAALSLSIIFLVCFTLLSSSSKPARESQPTQKAGENRVTTTILSLSPDSLSLKAKTALPVSVNINTGKDKVAAVKLVITFDPKIVKVDSVSPSTFFVKSSILHKEIDNKTGIAQLVVGSIEPKSGTGEVALVKITALKDGDPALKISKDSEASAIGKTYNVLK